MKRGVLLVLAIALIASACAQIKTPNARTLEQEIPQLRIQGNLITAGGNETVILKGAAIEDPAIASRGVFFGAAEEDLKQLSSWGFNLVRVPVHPEEYKKDRGYLRKYVDLIAKSAQKNRIYVLIDWHAHGNPFTGQVEPKEDGTPNTQVQADMALTKDFWAEASRRYANNPAVMYSIFNEPAFLSWSEWKKGAEEIISAIRAHDKDKIVFVSGLYWGADLREAGKNPIMAGNIAYEVHPYPAVYPEGPKSWDEYFGYLAGTYPVFAGEWGYEPSGKVRELNATAENYGTPLITYMERKNISWSAWVWSDLWSPPMLKNWEYEPTEFGALVKAYLRK